MKTELWAILFVFAIGFIGAFGPIYLKKGVHKINFRKFSTIYTNKFLIIGVFIHVITALMFIAALKGGELSVLYPLVGLAYVWVCVYSVFMLEEKMNILKWLGIALVVVGVAFIGLGA